MRVHHIAFRTADLARLEVFYVDVLGFTVSRRQADYSVWLDAGGALLMLERAEAGEPEVPPGSMELVAFAAAPGDEAKLAAAGVPIEARTAFTVYFRDPDGRRIALSHYPLER
jgi:catechol 2,3-dioxygenase-like lactoylglutathione lyase family enzyme